MCTIFSPQKRLETEHLIPAPQVSHTGSRKASASPGFLHACLARHCSAPLSLCAQTPSERKPSSARYRSLITASPRGTCLRDATTGAASVRCHRSIPTHCGTCLRFALAGAAHSRQPLPRQSVIGTFPHPRSAAAAVRCARETFVPCSFSARRLLPCAACCRSRPSACRRRE